ncbi:MAG: hypothetical protein SGJ17_12125 [Hyphomicrobiales bacterium]|nr:hypothetical protein [Hyphomicrobiales bacterium]
MKVLIFAALAVIFATGATAQTDPAKPSATEKKPAAASTAAAPKQKPVQEPAGGAAIFKENGKTCSGQDQYKVCW